MSRSLSRVTFLDFEETTDPVVYLDRLERLQAEMEKLEAAINDKLFYVVSSWGCLLEYDVIRQRF